MQVEDVARVRLSSSRTTKEERYRPVRVRLLREIVEDHQRMLTLIHPVLPDGRPGVGSDVLEGRGEGGSGVDDHRVVHRAVFLKRVDDLGDGGALLPDGHVHALDLLLRIS